MKYLFGMFFAMLIGHTTLYAQQEFSGRVVDETGRAIPNLVLKLKGLEISTVSDTGGNFKIWLPNDTGTVEFSDYGDYSINKTEYLSDNKLLLVVEEHSIDFLLELSLEELSNFSVTVAGKTREKVTVIPASVIIIPRKDIETYGYTSVSELLRHITGLYLIDGYRSFTGILGVRGLWADEHDNDNYAILVNNIYQYSSKLAIPLQAIDRVEVIRGPMSVIYGSGSMYGAINIVTNEGDRNIASVSYGTGNAYHTFARITGKRDNFGYTLNVGFEKWDGFDVRYKDIMGNTGFSEFQTIEKEVYSQSIPDGFSTEKHLEKELMYINFYGGFNGFYLSASYVNEVFEQFFLYPAFERGNRTNNSTANFTAGFQKELLSALSINAKTSYQKTTMEQDYDFFVPLFYGNQQERYNISETVIDLNYDPFKKVKIVAGWKYAAVFDFLNITDVAGSQDPMLTNKAESADFYYGQLGTFAQANYNPFGSLKLIGGIRLEKTSAYTRDVLVNGGSTDSTLPTQTARLTFDESEWLAIPRLAAVYSLTDRHIFKMLYGKATQIHQYGFDPKKQITYEFDYLFTEKAYSIGANAYRSQLKNRVDAEFVFDYEKSTYSNIFTNSGDITTNGVELNFIARPLSNLTVELGAAYQVSTDDDEEEITVAYSPNLLGQAKAMYRLKYFSLGLTGYYVDEMESMWVKKNPDSGEDAHRLGAGSESYFITGANLRADNIVKGLFASLRVSNLFDIDIRYPTIQTTKPLRAGTLGPPRVFTATLGYRF